VYGGQIPRAVLVVTRAPCRPVSLLEKYSAAGMADLWAASSFKGSTCVYTCVPSTQRHVDNHVQWLKVAAAVSAAVNLQGIAITGWQRQVVGGLMASTFPFSEIL